MVSLARGAGRKGSKDTKQILGYILKGKNTEAKETQDKGTVGTLELEGGRMSRDPLGKGEEKRQMGI